MVNKIKEDIKKKRGAIHGRPKKFSEEQIIEMGEKMLEIMREEDCWHLSYYLAKEGVSRRWFYDTIESYPTFSHYAERARHILVAKYSNQAMANNKGNQWMIKTYITRWAGERKEYLKELQEEAEITARAKAAAELDRLQEANQRATDLINALDRNCQQIE